MSNIRKDIDDNKEYIVSSLLNGSKTPTDLILEFNCKYDTLRSRTKIWIPDYKPDCTAKIKTYGGQNRHNSLIEYFNKKGKRCLRSILYRLLVSERGNFCSECKIGPRWNGKDLKLQVDHINGECYDNHPSNLRLLCPNCHAQTETFTSKRPLKRGDSDEDE